MNHKLELMDQFDDAAFALMMDEYAEAEGERLRAEFEEAMRSGTTPECPPELDEKCRKQIKHHFGRQRRTEYARAAKRIAGRAIACLLIALGISAALVMSVEALRVPFWKFWMKNYGSQIEFNFSDFSESDAQFIDPVDTEDPVLYYVPEGYYNVMFEVKNGRITSKYETDEGRFLSFEMQFSNIGFPDESWAENLKEFKLLDFDAEYQLCYYTEEGWPVSILQWYDPEIETMYYVMSNELDEASLISLCRSLAKCFYDLSIDQKAQLPDPLEGKLPESYVAYGYCQQGWPYYLYLDGDKAVSFSALEMDGSRLITMEATATEEMIISDFEATHMTGADELITMWYDMERELVFQFYTRYMPEEDHLALCEYLAEYYKGVTLPAVSTVLWE